MTDGGGWVECKCCSTQYTFLCSHCIKITINGHLYRAGCSCLHCGMELGVGEDTSPWTCHDDQCSLILLLPYICYCPGGCFPLLKQKSFMHSAVARAVQTLKCGYVSFLLMKANPRHKRSKLFPLSPPWHGGLYNELYNLPPFQYFLFIWDTLWRNICWYFL